MTEYICEQCGSVTVNSSSAIGTGTSNILKTIFYLIGFIIFLGIPIIGWILAIYLLFQPIGGSQKKICPHCKNENCLIPVETPKGRELYNKYN